MKLIETLINKTLINQSLTDFKHLRKTEVITSDVLDVLLPFGGFDGIPLIEPKTITFEFNNSEILSNYSYNGLNLMWFFDDRHSNNNLLVLTDKSDLAVHTFTNAGVYNIQVMAIVDGIYTLKNIKKLTIDQDGRFKLE